MAGANPRWIGSGRTLLDNKGNPVKQYEPYFSTTDAYEDEDEIRQLGVTPILQYDPVGRQTRVDYPDGTFETVMFDGWSQTTFDRCDNVVGSDWEAERTSSLDEDVQRALQASQTHANTPSRGFLDSQGRPVRTEETPDGTTWHATVMKYDVQGNTLSVTDARGIVTQADTSDAMGRPSYSTSPDAGESWVLLDVGGQPIRVWKTGDLTVRHTYDVLRRPVGVYVQDGVSAPERLAEAMFYGDFLYDAGGSDRTLAENGNLRARPWRTYDGAGVVEVGGYDFKGNPLSSSRTFLSTVDAEPDWVAVLKGSGGNPPPSDLAGLNSEAAPNLLTEVWTTSTTFDALNRVATQTTPDNSVTRPTYDDGGALTSVDVDVRGTTPATAFVRELEHNARGQRTLIAYSKNAAGDGGAFTTTYEYDDKTYRLIRLRTVLDGGSVVLQDWRYVYDAAGNIVKVHDDVADTVYFNNGVADATLLYKYDALYRLVSAQGREHASQQAPDPGDPSIPTMGGIPDTNACATYVQEYSYDAVGNITRMHHQQGDESSPGSTVWDIAYTYASDSNRLVSTTHPTTSAVQSYVHSARGAMTSMPHLQWGMTRDWRDQLRHVVLDAGANADEAHYHYDAEGQRVRKVIEHSSGTKERLYLGGFEVYRELDTLGVVTLERETLHVMDGERRIAMVDTETTAPVVSSIFRFQLGNHLDSVSAEVDKDGNLLTYEEFHPYGTTAWKATVSGISLKRYRYTGMERDDETGLALHGVRFYAPWLARWCSADPIGLAADLTRFSYTPRPIVMMDTSGRRPLFVLFLSGDTPPPPPTAEEQRLQQLRIAAMRHGRTQGIIHALTVELREHGTSWNSGAPMRPWDIEHYFSAVQHPGPILSRGRRGQQLVDAGLAEVENDYWHSTVARDAMDAGLITSKEEHDLFYTIAERSKNDYIQSGAAFRGLEIASVFLGPMSGAGGAAAFIRAPFTAPAALSALNRSVRSATIRGITGAYRNVVEAGHSLRSIDYQEYVSRFFGVNRGGAVLRAGTSFVQDGVKFDALDTIRGVLLEAKGPGFAKFVNRRTGEFYGWFRGADDLVDQARRQVSASNGAPVEWIFHEVEALQATRTLFQAEGVTGITLRHLPQP